MSQQIELESDLQRLMDRVDRDILSKYGLREDEMEESLEAMSKDYAESNQVLEQFMNADLLFQ